MYLHRTFDILIPEVLREDPCVHCSLNAQLGVIFIVSKVLVTILKILTIFCDNMGICVQVQIYIHVYMYFYVCIHTNT